MTDLDKIDAALETYWDEHADSLSDDAAPDPAIKLKQSIADLLVEARIDEIGGVVSNYGTRVTETYVTGEAQTVEQRFKQLKKGIK